MKMVIYKENELPVMTEKRKEELRALSERLDNEIDYSDIPPLDDDFWKRTVLWKDVVRSDMYRPKKVVITARLDADVLEWLKMQGQGYQTRMNAILRKVMMQSQ